MARSISHPLAGLLSQLAKEPTQPVSWQVPEAHEVVALGSEQVTPQAPQLAFVLRLVSQPLAALPSQFPKPELQVGTQALEVQAVLPFGLVQGLEQAPQLLMSLVVFVSQPFEELPSQFP